MRYAKDISGMQYAVRSYGNAAAWCSLSIKAGTRNEDGFSAGIAHFCEHTIFKGTSRRSSSMVNNCLESRGGELNAFTAKEETVLHATTLKEDIGKAAALLLELAFDSTFPADEIEVEKGVVIDEIASYKDTPSEDIYDSFEERIFAGSPMSRQILGTQESVQGITSEELLRYRRRFFVPEAMTLTLVAPMPEDELEKLAQKTIREAMKRYPDASRTPSAGIAAAAPCTCAAPIPTMTAPSPTFNITEDKDDNQVNCIVGALAPALDCGADRYAAIMLCNMLGGPFSNSALGGVLREKHGWVYNVDCTYTPYSDTGIATIQFGCEKENLKRCLKVIDSTLRKFRETPISQRRLQAARRQMLGLNAIGMESGEAQCISMGKAMMCFGGILTDAQIAEKVAAVTPEQIQDMARRIFAPERISTLIYL